MVVIAQVVSLEHEGEQAETGENEEESHYKVGECG